MIRLRTPPFCQRVPESIRKLPRVPESLTPFTHDSLGVLSLGVSDFPNVSVVLRLSVVRSLSVSSFSVSVSSFVVTEELVSEFLLSSSPSLAPGSSDTIHLYEELQGSHRRPRGP